MDRPPFIIGGHHVHILKKPLLEDYGEFDPATNTIFVNSSHPRSHQEATVLHELFHVMNPTLADNHHELCESLSQQFYQFFIANHLPTGFFDVILGRDD